MKKLYENDLRFYNYDPLFNTKQLELHLLPGKYCKDLSHNDKMVRRGRVSVRSLMDING